MRDNIITPWFSVITIAICFFTSLQGGILRAQTIDPTYISISEGLVFPNVQDVIQDSYGLIWIATENGIQKYDGHRFETFKNIPQKPNSLLNNNVWGLTEDSEHNIWAATDQGISRFNRGKKIFTNYDFKKQFNLQGSAGMAFKVIIDSKKRIWAATLSNELLLYDPTSDHWNHATYELKDSARKEIPNGRVFGFTEDKQGGIWIGSSNFGLMYRSKSDSSFKPVHINQTEYVSFTNTSNAITALYADSVNVIWITSRNGVYKYNPADGNLRTIQTYNYNQIDPWNNWNSIHPDHKGNVWIANNFRGILKFEGTSDRYHEISISGIFKLKDLGWNLVLTNFMVDKTGIFWFGSRTSGLIKYNPERNPFTLYSHDAMNKQSISNNSVFGLLESKVNPGIIYVGTRGGGLNVFDQKKKTFHPITYHAKNDLYGGSVRSIGEEDDGSLWLGTFGDGLIKLDQNFNEVNRYTYNANSDKSLSDNKVRVIRKDVKGNFWVGTNNGLNYFQPKTGEFKRIYSKMARMYPRKLIDQIEALALTESKVAGIINVTDYQDLSRDFEINKPGKYLVMEVGENFEGNLAYFGWIEKNVNDTIWSSTNFQKTYYAGGSAKNRIVINQLTLAPGKYKLRYHSDDSHSYNNWNEAAPDQTTLYGIVLIDMTGKNLEESILELEAENRDQQIISGNNITAIALGKDHVWVGTDPDGLNRIDLISNKIKTFQNDPGNNNSISSNTIFDVYEDEKGIVWITTDAGINRFDPISEHFTRYTEKDGLTTNLTESILPGDNGEMWVSTQAGLSQMVPGTLPGKFTFINYNAEDGLGGDTFLAQAAARTADGKFYFGGDHGLNALSRITANNIPPDLIFTNLLISNKSVYDMGDNSPLSGDLLDQKEIHLTYDQNNLSFEFAALHYANQHKNQYAHLLKGYDKGWVYDNHNYASYTNLDPGKYEFIIRASNAYGVWNENGKSIQIIISPPWWRTWWAYGAFGLLFAMGLFGFDRFMRRRLILRERERSREIELAQAKEIEKAYTNLKTTQSQLIQAEKMASLGELTAGIAHEIQNPLNFVNNFSEINRELIQEMKDEIENGNLDEVKKIADDISANEQKISHHGKRADAIVKGMLQHSRSSSGLKEPTDINALADEYMRLSYHGLRAKDKSFNATLKTDFDNSIGTIQIVPQDMGRVILNLITNAFYAVNQKKALAISAGEKFEPTVTVSTRNTGESILISVKDNGNGIPQRILDKIFQPFFTTKPTGEGTGLGLSLSYDIVKAHGGELEVETKEGEGSIFLISIPA